MVDLRDFDLSNKSAARRLRKKRKESVKLRSEYFPRIHDIHEITRFVSLFSEYGEISHEDIGRQSSQGLNHVMHACKILNLISSEGKLTKLTAGFHVREMREKLSLVALGISSSKPVEKWMQWLGVDSIFSVDLGTASRFVKEIYFLNGEVSSFIPENVLIELKKIKN